MANHETNTDSWVDERLAGLGSTTQDWKPNRFAALTQLRLRSRVRRASARRWFTATALASVGCVTLLLVPATRACAQEPVGCVKHAWESVFDQEPSEPLVAATHPPTEEAPAAPKPSVPEKPARPVATPPPVIDANVAGPAQRSFKESGNPSAPITVEIYTDLECPPCASFSLNVVPSLVAQYVQTGKVRLLYRDFPLPTHRFAQLAARYANAAGELGYYQVAREQIYRTQSVWKQDGDIGARLSEVLPAEIMRKVREKVTGDPKLDEMIAADLASAREDRLNQTPSLVIVHKGNRQVISGAATFESLKSYLDGLER